MLFRVIGNKLRLRFSPPHPFIFNRNIATMSASFKLACVQLDVSSNKRTNLNRAKDKILEAAREGANVVVLPVRIKFWESSIQIVSL
jgi:hypothetical protein